MTQFKDLFSKQAVDYSRFRPVYPGALFDAITLLSPARDCAWDCGTGNGQAALELATRFKRVLATDASPKQLASAGSHERVSYSVGTAEASGLPAGVADLITVAQAFHWFKHDRFYEEVRRVAKPTGAVLALWSYALAYVNPEIDRVVTHYYQDVIGSYWEPERRLVEEGYASIRVPFEELESPRLEMSARWTLEHLVGYLGTWSATQSAAAALGRNPLTALVPELSRAWGAVGERTIRWPLSLRTFKVVR